MLLTSLSEIKSFNPCISGWKAILKGQGKTRADSVLFPLVDCVESNSISDVCWLLGKRKIEKPILVLFAQSCAKSVQHLKNIGSRRADDAAAAAYDAADAAAYAADADAATYAAYVADAAAYAADAAADAAAYAADAAADAAAYVAADAATYAAYVADAAAAQEAKNKKFLIDAIIAHE